MEHLESPTPTSAAKADHDSHVTDSPDAGPRSLERFAPQIETIAASQGLVVARRQLISIGMTSPLITDWVRQRRLVEQARGVYALRGANVLQSGRRWAAMLSCGGDPAITGLQAFDGLGLTSEARSPIHVVRSVGHTRRQDGIVEHRAPDLPARDVVVLDGLRFTTFARSCFHLGDMIDADHLDRAMDRAVHTRQFDQAAFDRLLAGYPRTPGIASIRAALARLDQTSGRNRSELERRLIRLILASDIPAPAVNARLAGFEVDLHWIGTRAVVEADGDRYHSSPAQLARDAEKQAALEAAGFVIRRVDRWSVDYRPERTVREVEQFRLANLAPPVPAFEARNGLWLPGT